MKTMEDLTEKKDPEQLFQDSWFFGNLLRTISTSSCSSKNKPAKSMLRSFSDPYASSSCRKKEILTAEKSYEGTFKSIKKLQDIENPSLMKAPSLLPSRRKASSSALIRAPSLPTSLLGRSTTREFEDDEEIEFSMAKLIRQASMKKRFSDNNNNQVLTPNSSLSRQSSMKKQQEADTVVQIMEGLSEDVIPQVPMKQLQPQKSLATSSLKYDELQGFKDLGFQFENIDLNPKVASSSISPKFQEKKRTEEKNIRISYHVGEPLWGRNSSAPPVPKRGGKRPTGNEVMKEQIRFWARAVASNVRQEC